MGSSESYSTHTLREFLAALAADTPAPGGGAAVAVASAFAAALVEMAAELSRDHDAGNRMPELRERAAAARREAARLADEDTLAYGRVIDAQRLPARDPSRQERVAGSLSEAADVPLAIAQEAADLAELAAEVAAAGNPNLRGDALAAALLAEAAAQAAARLVEINLAAADGDARTDRARALAERALAAREETLAGGVHPADALRR